MNVNGSASVWHGLVGIATGAALAACGDGASATDSVDADASVEVETVESPDFRIAGLSGPVEAIYDHAGVLHLRCATDADCFAAQGYFHARDRFIQMDLQRREVTGRFAAAIGAPVLQADKAARLHWATRDGGDLPAQILAGADASARAAYEAYARGVNAWIADLRAGQREAALPPPYAVVAVGPELVPDWEPSDSVACLLPWGESWGWIGSDLFMAELVPKLPAALAHDFLVPAFIASPVMAALAGPPAAASAPVSAPVSAGWQARLAELAPLVSAARAEVGPPPRRGVGSNNWAVAPTRTNDGSTLFAMDPHSWMTNPAMWYLVELDATAGTGTLHAAGASRAGIPGVLYGQNEDIAWGPTYAYFDMADVYVETLSPDGQGVMFNGHAVPFVVREREIAVRYAGTVHETQLYVPHHGPVLAIDRDAGTALTGRVVAQDGDTDLSGWLALQTATDLTSAKAALSKLTWPNLSFIVADRRGHIGWFPFNRVPRRPWASPEMPSILPVPGDGAFEWDGWVDHADLPQAVDPERGIIATANNDFLGHLSDGDPSNDYADPAIQVFVSDGARHARIVERLTEPDARLDRAAMVALQSDDRSAQGALLVPALLSVIDGDGGGASALPEPAHAAYAALAAWDFACPTGLSGTSPDAPIAEGPAAASARGCAVYHVLLKPLGERLLGDELAAVGVAVRPWPEVLLFAVLRPEWLVRSEGYWDDITTPDVVETAREVIVGALGDAATWLGDELGGDPTNWVWGRLHTLTLEARTHGLGVTAFDLGPFAVGGGYEIVAAGMPRDMGAHDYATNHSSNFRLACSGTPERSVACVFELPGGQRDAAGDAHAADLLPLYLRGEATALPFGPDAVGGAAERRFVVEP